MKKGISSIGKGQSSGFSLVEIAVVIVVISILVSISAIGMTIYLKDARDTERTTKISIIAEALEKYYDKNGEYPSCSAVRDNLATVITTLGGIDEDVLRPPKAELPTGLNCNNGSAAPSADTDIFMYEPLAGSPTDPSQARSSYQLQYWSEADKSITSKQSRRN